jgi:phosphoglycerate dehydrogenase-like enzyme
VNSTSPSVTATLVAEHAFALLLAVSRRTAYFTAAVRAGRWPRRLATSLLGKTLGVVGTGNIGCEMIRLSRAFGMDVIAWSFHPNDEKAARLGFRYVELEELFAQSDALSLHLKLTDKSRGFIGEKELAQVRPGCLLVNTARGAMIDNASVIAALEDGRLGGVALDVFDQEPIRQGHPLLQCEQVVFTPHSADQTPEGVDLLNLGCVENVIAFLEGRPQNVVVYLA